MSGADRALALRAEPVLAVSTLRASVTANAASAAWNEAADCLTKGDFAGFDAAMRLFRKFNEKEAS